MLDSLLAKEEWRKYQLLKRLERSPYFSLTKKEMMDQLEISNFVLKSMIDQLVLDLEKYGLAQEIHVFLEDPFIQLEITGTASSETLLEKYVEESISFQLLLSAVLGTFRSLNEFSEKALISYPLARSNYKQLNKYLAAFNFKIDKKFRLIGDCEKNLRLFLTELFSRIYKTDFSIFNQTDKSFVEGRQVYLLMTGMTVHQKINFQQYLYITDLRIQQQKYVEDQEKSCLLRENIQEEAENSFFRRVPENFREAEVIAFLRYYYSRSEDLAIGLKLTENEQIIDWSQKLLAGLLHHFPNLTGYSEHKNVFLRRSCLLHFQLMETSQAYEELQPEMNILYFQQTYPKVLVFCKKYINDLKDTDLGLFKKKKQVLFHYLFFILESFPKINLLEMIYIYVDFSFGSSYNKFIVENLDFFHIAGAEVADELESSDIILTDSRDLGEKYKKDYVVWLAPPRPLDWANLGQKISNKRAEKKPI